MSTGASTSEGSLQGADSRSAAPAHMDLAAGLALVAGTAVLVSASLGLNWTFTLKATAVYAVSGLLILWGHPGHFPGPGLGTANRVTLVRLVLALPLAAMALHPAALSVAGRWWVVALGTLVLSLDGVDGWVARRTGTDSPFGARFDMETDAALIMVLSWLTWVSGQAPAWILLIGGMRYLFVAAGTVLPALNAPLFPSFRRKVFCVVQGIALVTALAPIVPRNLATLLGGAALAGLIWSFAIDTSWLLRRPGRDESAPDGTGPLEAGT